MEEKKNKIYNSGVYCSEEEYFAINAINSSTIKKFLDAYKKMSAEEFLKFDMCNPNIIEKYFDVKTKHDYTTLKNFAIGSIIHKMCLEMDRFEDQEDFKNFDDFCDHLLKVALYTHGNISEMEKDVIKRCYKSWIESKFDLEDKKIELAFFNTFQGMPLKGKIDMIGKKDGKIIVVDIKTIRSFKAIEENIKRYYYWFQTLYYKLLLSFEENGEFVDIVDDIYLIFLSKSEFGTRVLKFSDLNENEKTREFEEFKKIVKMYHRYYTHNLSL